MPYRVLPSAGEEVTLVFRATYWLRLLATVRAGRTVLTIYALVALLLALAVAWLIGFVKFTDAQYDSVFGASLSVFPTTLCITLGLVVLPLFLVIAIRCITPSPFEALLPSRVVFRSHSIDVWNRAGEPSTESWSYIAEATERAGNLELLIGHQPRITLFVAKRRLSPLQHEMLTRWIDENGVRRA